MGHLKCQKESQAPFKTCFINILIKQFSSNLPNVE